MSNLFRKGRLTSVRKDVTRFTSSVNSDKMILKPVVKINQAHIIMLIEQKIINASDGRAILVALASIKDMRKKIVAEDAHMYVEEEVTNSVGHVVGGNLHIAKSRNDQVSTAIRITLRENLNTLIESIVKMQESIITLATKHVETIFPGYTHLQPAQPVTFSHYLVAYVDALERDVSRLEEVYSRVNQCPMGACAIATTSFKIDREIVAKLLGFTEILENSIDAVSARDFILETMAAIAIHSVNVSRIVEDLILWNSLNFGLIEIPDEFASTSSIMPQKKNPDPLEVIRARTGNVIGCFLNSVTILRALPSGYNLDFQEVTPLLWNSFEITMEALDLLSKLLPNLTIYEKTLEKPVFNLITSTELANILTRKYKVPFRTAHRIVGALCKLVIDERIPVSRITPELLERITHKSAGIPLKILVEDLKSAFDPMKFVEAHSTIGGPSPSRVKKAIESRKERINSTRKWLTQTRSKLVEADASLEKAIKVHTIESSV
ncbi:MAG: argininosuccinate lyase [Thermoproteota archaeon]|nr:argininosuccinate lyase [Thermoproteota archaeon]